jgi:putative ABC transport system permease protein
MKAIYYALKNLMHHLNGNLIKVISIGLGLTLSILLFARVAFEMSYDSNYRDPDDLYQLFAVWIQKGERHEPSDKNMGPVAGAILENFPEEVEAATSTCRWIVAPPLYYGEVRFDEQKVMADSLFFQTMGIEVLRGNTRELINRDVIFLSDRFARKIFGDEDPMDKVVQFDKTLPMTVKGIYRALPENTRFRWEAVVSMPTMWTRNLANYSWYGGDSYEEFIRFKPNADKQSVLNRLDQMMAKYVPARMKEMGIDCTTIARPITSVYKSEEEVKSTILIMSLLALAILFITALNYVLISISSLAYRAKAVGVHKCNGASGGNILSMFLVETGAIILLALILMGFLLWQFRDFVEDTAAVTLPALFTPTHLWIPVLTVAVLFLLGGVLPGRLFAHIPVTQVFRRYTDGKKRWKRPLLFVQFAGVALIVGITTLMLMQYHHVLNKDMGYNPHNIAYGKLNFKAGEEQQAAEAFFRNLPYVEEVAAAWDIPLNGPSGNMIQNDAGQTLFSSRIMGWTTNYPELMGMKFIQGRMAQKPTEAVVNETFVRDMNWDGEVLNRIVHCGNEDYTVVGELKDYQIASFLSGAQPLITFYQEGISGVLHLKLKEPFDQSLQQLNKDAAEAYHNRDVLFLSMDHSITITYNNLRVFRNASLIATIVLFFIMLMGLTGYVSDEVRRRSKEIAIRKVNGAEASDILRLLNRDILLIALPAVIVGSLCAWYLNGLWMSIFVEQVQVGWMFYPLLALLVLVVIVVCVSLRSRHIAYENPVDSIQNE